MPRFYYEYRERKFSIHSWVTWRRYFVFDHLRGSDEAVAECKRSDDAEKIVDALNAAAK
jgi:hypothetical protein